MLFSNYFTKIIQKHLNLKEIETCIIQNNFLSLSIGWKLQQSPSKNSSLEILHELRRELN